MSNSDATNQDDPWRYYALVDPPDPPYGVIRQRGPEIERWSPTRRLWYVAMFHADVLWRGERGAKPISNDEAESIMESPNLVDIHPSDIDALNRSS